MKLLLVFIALACTGSLSMAQFTATMKNVVSGHERIYQVYNDTEKYRYEFTEEGMAGVVIVMPAENKAYVLMPEKKYVHQTTCDSRMIRMNDPVSSVRIYQEQGASKDEGVEKVGDYTCRKSSISQGDTRLFTVWQSEKLNFPIKIENHYAKDSYMELVDINSWDVVDSYFKVPDGYTEVDDEMRPIIPEPPAPESWSTKDVTIPFEGKVIRGTKIKMVIPESVYYKFITTNAGDTPTKFTYHLYENGEKLSWDVVGNDDRRTHRLYMEEKKTQTMDWKKDWELIIEVYEGEVSMEVFPE